MVSDGWWIIKSYHTSLSCGIQSLNHHQSASSIQFISRLCNKCLFPTFMTERTGKCMNINNLHASMISLTLNWKIFHCDTDFWWQLHDLVNDPSSSQWCFCNDQWSSQTFICHHKRENYQRCSTEQWLSGVVTGL